MRKSIWFKPYSLEEINAMLANTLVSHLGININNIGESLLQGTMPIDNRTIQPNGILHGGASVALAETLGSVAGHLTIDPKSHACVGQEINASHVRPCSEGYATGVASPVRLGKTAQVWNIDLINEQEKLICKARLTLAVISLEVLR